MRYLDRHYAEPYDQGRLAHDACVSRQLLQRLFQERFGHSPRTHLQMLRVAKAKALLASSGRTIAEAARAVGYRDPRNFRRLFAKHVE